MGQIIKSRASVTVTSVCLSVHPHIVAILKRFWWNFAP